MQYCNFLFYLFCTFWFYTVGTSVFAYVTQKNHDTTPLHYYLSGHIINDIKSHITRQKDRRQTNRQIDEQEDKQTESANVCRNLYY